MKERKGRENGGVRKKKRKKRELVIERGERGVVHEADIQAELLIGEEVGQGTIKDQEARKEGEAGTSLKK